MAHRAPPGTITHKHRAWGALMQTLHGLLIERKCDGKTNRLAREAALIVCSNVPATSYLSTVHYLSQFGRCDCEIMRGADIALEELISINRHASQFLKQMYAGPPN